MFKNFCINILEQLGANGFSFSYLINFRVLRFGNHDRLANPQDCQQFFSCLRTGQPRLGACPKKTVFNEATGHCDDPNNVKGW